MGYYASQFDNTTGLATFQLLERMRRQGQCPQPRSNLVAVGDSSLYKNLTGNYNTALGSKALLNSTSGNGNTASGSEVMLANTTGNANTAFGRVAFRKTPLAPTTPSLVGRLAMAAASTTSASPSVQPRT
ncbi:MAG: hypothetical protein IPM82_01105 [Saprospiraceae bacterium]|nr:hypothetical protein [Saprospiraceae bacterium]